MDGIGWDGMGLVIIVCRYSKSTFSANNLSWSFLAVYQNWVMFTAWGGHHKIVCSVTLAEIWKIKLLELMNKKSWGGLRYSRKKSVAFPSVAVTWHKNHSQEVAGTTVIMVIMVIMVFHKSGISIFTNLLHFALLSMYVGLSFILAQWLTRSTRANDNELCK